MRGTWQGSGTWQTSGPDFTGLIGVAVLIGAAAAAAMVVLEFIWYIVAVLAVAAIGFVIGFISVRRRTRAHAAMLEATREERHQALGVTPKAQVTQGTPPPVIVNNYGPQYHVYGADARRPVPVIPGKVITSKEERP